MNRYLYYMIFLNMLVASVGYVPNVLFSHRLDGSVLSILLAPLIGGGLIALFVNSMKKFPKKGLPEVIDTDLPKWVGKPYLFLLAMIWFWAAVTGLLSTVIITIRYINPDLPSMVLTVLLTIMILLMVRLKSTTILYSLEILIIVSVPLILLIMFKSYTGESITWNSVIEAGNYFYHLPTWNTLAAATYSFSGYINMVIFNRVFQGKVSGLFILATMVVGLGTLVTLYIIPIGYLGFDIVHYFTFPWITSTDAMRMGFGLIERVMYLFIFFHYIITIVNIIIHGHVAFELLKSVFKLKKSNQKKQSMVNGAILLVFAILFILLENKFNQNDSLLFGIVFLNLRFAVEISLVLLLFFLARRKKA